MLDVKVPINADTVNRVQHETIRKLKNDYWKNASIPEKLDFLYWELQNIQGTFAYKQALDAQNEAVLKALQDDLK